MKYEDIYTYDFFRQADGMAEWEKGRLKCGDALAAIGYALGLSSLEALRAIVPFEGAGRGDDASDGLRAVDQLLRVRAQATRAPHGVLEIGSGRGEVSAAFAYMGYPTQAVEPSPGAKKWIYDTYERFFGRILDSDVPFKLHNAAAHHVLDTIDWSSVDTVIMVESLEHILAEDFAPVYERIRSRLNECGGRFVVTNWVDYHPINVGDYARAEIHCRLVDDALYNAWSADARTVVYRNGSHLVLDY